MVDPPGLPDADRYVGEEAVPMDVPTVGRLYAFENGKVRNIRQYLTRTEAREAAAVSE